MKIYGKMLVFITMLGLFTSGVLLVVNALTLDRIAENEAAALYSTILDGNDIDYTIGTITETFEEEIEVHEFEGLTYYIHTDSGRVSFEFEGGGVWGPIIGVLTLEDDFETIKAISILQQEETPGLGGVVAEEEYLETFVGKKMTPEIVISKEADTSLDNEVDSITGATRTSEAFQAILNEAYGEYQDALDDYQE
ncbi:MAG: FMN-binding protein [Candidatus Izemoplasmataceae bacterium]